MTTRPYDLTVDDGLPVVLPSGANFLVPTEDERQYVIERSEKYLTENKYTNVSDIQDVDKMVVFELFLHRWSLWLSKGKDYYDDDVDPRALARQINDISGELRGIKKNLGVDKVGREKQRGEESTALFLRNLLVRAKEFGITRDKQHAKTIELMHELKALITYHDGCDPAEQQERNVTQNDVFEWIRKVAIPEFDSIDIEFRMQQQMWIRDQ